MIDYPHPDDVVESEEWYNAWIEWHNTLERTKNVKK